MVDHKVSSMNTKIESFHSQGNWLRDLILGGQDGLVNVWGIVLGVGAAGGSKPVLIAASLAAAFAEAVSMAAVAYTSRLAEKDFYEKEEKREYAEVESVPEKERQEIRDIYQDKGFSGKLLEEIVETLSSNKKIWVDTMMSEELKLERVETRNILWSALLVGVTALIGSFVPIAPYFFLSIKTALPVSVTFSMVVLFGIGAYKAKTMVGSWWKAGIQMTLIGTAAAIVGFFIGKVFGV